jgi:hypothetical protein
MSRVHAALVAVVVAMTNTSPFLNADEYHKAPTQIASTRSGRIGMPLPRDFQGGQADGVVRELL